MRAVAPWCALALAALGLSLAGPALPRALADGGAGPPTYGSPPDLPPGSHVDDDEPRRDIHMGNIDHMRMGRDEEGNIIMEVRPRPKKVEQQPQVGPFYIYPQIGVPGQRPMGGQPGMGMGQPGRPGQGGQLPMGQPGPGQPAPGQPTLPGQGVSGQPGPSLPATGTQPGQSTPKTGQGTPGFGPTDSGRTGTGS